ncbi:hypothetical protein FSP39_016784 [Pinctada imbricata]|uniref:DEAD-box helicase OB fold domain-containing protein n=1 Tax=Pinctada imbricata TaxID=66713 RepID=A0AA88XRR8_PINIB|nr:hypothetical protein FSP39_016784 [Pinctada imbricata]
MARLVRYNGHQTRVATGTSTSFLSVWHGKLDITAIKPEWLQELAPHFYQYGTDRELAAKRSRTSDLEDDT